MSTETTNYRLKKPSADEFYDISVHNDNADIIDAQMKENADAAENAGRHIADKMVHITEEERKNWDDADSKKHGHSNKGVLDATTASYTAADKAKLDGVAAGANAYTHPTTPGSKHIPSGGSSGQILRWSADGTAAWGADSNTTYSNMGAATATAAGKAGLVPAPPKGAQDKFLRGDGTFQTPTNTVYTHPNSGVAAGTYRSLTVNAQGHVTDGSNPVLPVAQGGTGATTAAQALANIGAAAASHTHNYAAASHTHNYAGSASAGGMANRALGDSDGAQISTTYRKKSEGSIVRIQQAAPEDTTALHAW